MVAAESPAGHFSSAEGLFAAVRLYNSGDSELTQFTSPDCNLRFTAWQNEVVLVDRLSEMPCDGGLGGEVFAAYNREEEERKKKWVDYYVSQGMHDKAKELGWQDVSELPQWKQYEIEKAAAAETPTMFDLEDL